MPKDIYQTLKPSEQIEMLNSVSQKTGLGPVIIEKDYWVCRVLDALFSLPDLGEHLVFKGGTSLSKVYRIIERFSEDVDVSFHRDFLGFGTDRDPESAVGKEQKRRLDELQTACATCIRDRLLPTLGDMLEERLDGRGWELSIDPDDTQTILFRYPALRLSSSSYIARIVRIEMGARSDHWPQERHDIRSMMGEELDQPIGVATVQALAAERTFWEKATLLHAECHRDLNKAIPSRSARHYHDLARIAQTPVADRALADAELRKRVVAHKSVYFRSAWARYDLAVPTTFRLIPSAERIAELEKDHDAMQEMFFHEPPSMTDVIGVLADLEEKIRALPN